MAGEWREAMGLGFRARGEMVRVENGDGGRDSDSLLFMWPSLNRWRGKPIFQVEGKRETSNFRCVLAGLLDAVRNQIFGACWRDCLTRYLAETRIYYMF